MATIQETMQKMEEAAVKYEAVADAGEQVLISEGEKDILLPDGTTTPNLNKRIANTAKAVSSVNGKTGNVEITREDLGLKTDEMMARDLKEDRFVITENGETQRELNRALIVQAQDARDYVDKAVFNSGNGLKNFTTETALKAYVPTANDPLFAYAFDTAHSFEWVNNAWVDLGPSQFDLAKEYTDDRVKQTEQLNYEFTTNDGFKQAEIGYGYLSIGNAEIKEDPKTHGVSFKSEDGFNLLPSQKSDLSEAKDYTDAEILKIQNKIISTNQPVFTDLLVGFDGEDINISVECLVAQRALQRKQRTITASISANSLSYFKQSSEVLNIQANKINGSAKLYLRDIGSYNYTSLDITVKLVAKSGLSGSPKILMIGDSITNRGGAAIVNTVLKSIGMTPSFIGTITGSGTNEPALGTDGKLNEGREGWRTTQFTNALADKTPVPVGGESAYMALVKNDKIKWNPFIRVATSEDDASIIKNGYVLDFEFYRSRFSLETPDIVVLQLGTNDIVYAPATSEQNVYDNILFIMQRLRVAFPNCKIIVSAVGRAISTATTDAQYDSLYPPVFRSTQKAIKDSTFTNVYFCPSFAISDTFSGFPVTATETDVVSGAITGAYSDGLHPTYSGRQTLYTNISAYIAAATINLI